jgi:hypothetical protein
MVVRSSMHELKEIRLTPKKRLQGIFAVGMVHLVVLLCTPPCALHMEERITGCTPCCTVATVLITTYFSRALFQTNRTPPCSGHTVGLPPSSAASPTPRAQRIRRTTWQVGPVRSYSCSRNSVHRLVDLVSSF